MTRFTRWILPLFLLAAGTAGAQESRISPKQIYQKATPSLLGVQYTWVNELGKAEIVGAGIVVGDDLVMFSSELVNPLRVPDEQIRNCKIIIPRAEGDADEVDAIFQGRDERTNMAFLKPKKPQHWKPIKFEDVKVEVGQPIYSVGILPQAAAYKSYLMETRVAVELRGDVPTVLAQGGGLAAVGSPVFTAEGAAIGIVSFSQGQSFLLNRPEEALAAISNTPKFFVPARDFLISIQEPPTPEKPIKLPWTGLAQLTGLSKDVAEALDLKDKPAIQIGEVVPGTAAEKAGLKSGDIIVQVNGKALERGDEASELPNIFRRRLMRHKVGDELTFSILRDSKPMDIKVTMAEQPQQANLAKRFFADDLGFVVRNLVFNDIYLSKLPSDQKGVLVVEQRQQGASLSAGLQHFDIITRLNKEPVTDVEQFGKLYQQIRKDKPHEALVLVVQRRNAEETIRIEPPQ